MGKVQHLHSRITTILEAARLVRHRVECLADNVFDPESVDLDSLLGACGIASYMLSRVLNQLNIKCDFVMGRFWWSDKDDRGDHCWIELPREGLIVDVTATQFGSLATVHVTSGEDVRYRGELRNATAIRDLRGWGGQSHVPYKAVLDESIDDVIIQLFQSGYVSRG